MATARDVIGEIVAYNQPLLTSERRIAAADGKGDLTAQGVARKLEALAASPFGFFRGTFHLLVKDLSGIRVPGALAHAPDGLIVGDLHLDNFGAYRGASGGIAFDVNDFDDVGDGPLDLDVKRLCTSAFLLQGASLSSRRAAAHAIASAWADGIARLGGRFPVPAFTADKAEGGVKDLLAGAAKQSQDDLCGKLLEGKGQHAFAEAPGGRAIHPERAWVKHVEDAVAAYRKALTALHAPLPDDLRVLDVVYRFKGTGSLGRLRFQVLLGKNGHRRIFELKEARQCAMDEARGLAPAVERARVQTAAIRRLQGDMWPLVAGTHLAGLSALGRELQPEEAKLGSDLLAQGPEAALTSYARQCGEVLARLHVRMSAPAILGAAWDVKKCAEAAVAFAEKYATQVAVDHAAFVAGRAKAAQALGVPKAG